MGEYFSAESWLAATGSGTRSCLGWLDNGSGALVVLWGRGGMIAVPKGAKEVRVRGSGVRVRPGEEGRVGGGIVALILRSIARMEG
jgi:uncharacterized protein YycO